MARAAARGNQSVAALLEETRISRLDEHGFTEATRAPANPESHHLDAGQIAEQRRRKKRGR